MRRGPRIAVFDAGIHHRRAFQPYEIDGVEFLPIYNAETVELGLFDAIIVPFHTDQNVLSRMRRRLEAYARDDHGILVILGATEYCQSWLPFTHWGGRHPTDVTIVSRDADDGAVIFSQIMSTHDLEFNTTFVAHGYLQNAEGWEVLAQSNEGPIMAVKRKGLRGGVVLCTTLDPDYHTVDDVPCNPATERARVYEVTSKLLGNIMRWVKLEIVSIGRAPWPAGDDTAKRAVQGSQIHQELGTHPISIGTLNQYNAGRDVVAPSASVAQGSLEQSVGRSRYAEEFPAAAPRTILHLHLLNPEGMILQYFVRINQHDNNKHCRAL